MRPQATFAANRVLFGYQKLAQFLRTLLAAYGYGKKALEMTLAFAVSRTQPPHLMRFPGSAAPKMRRSERIADLY